MMDTTARSRWYHATAKGVARQLGFNSLNENECELTERLGRSGRTLDQHLVARRGLQADRIAELVAVKVQHEQTQCR
jgi:hypothetical protein